MAVYLDKASFMPRQFLAQNKGGVSKRRGEACVRRA
jgi:hypothetical protein